MHAFRVVIGRALDLCLPHRCAFCGVLLQRGALCEGCLYDLPWNRAACDRCARPLAEDATCGRCRQRPGPLEQVIAPLLYAYPVDAGIRALKFRHRSWYACAFTEVLVDALPRLSGEIDAVVAMPLHWRRHATRGFNQADFLARPVARALGVPLLRSVTRHRATQSQSGLDQRARADNVRNAFTCGHRVSARHVLVVDDVFSTGHSVKQLGHCLRAAGAQKVSALVIARAAQDRL